MRILYISRVFSGLETSLSQGVWEPTGVPTIYKVMEAFDKSKHEIMFVMPCKGIGSDYRTQWDEKNDEIVNMRGLQNPVHVLASEHRYQKWLGRLRSPLTNLRHLWCLFKFIMRFRPHFVYVDRTNLLAGSLLARLSPIPVILRVMGVYPSMWDTLSYPSLSARITRWSYRAPFALVICTQDGSGGEFWLPKALNPEVSYRMLLNGHTKQHTRPALDPKLTQLPKNKTIILFVGRFENIKGCHEFTEAILLLHSVGQRDIHALMVGTGRLYDSIRARVRDARADNIFTFIERLPHDQLPYAHKHAHIYVSLNHLGQLSNANLEAISMGACMIIPESQPDRGIDKITEQFLHKEAVVRIPWSNQVKVLADTISMLAQNPDRRHILHCNIQAIARKQIKNWDDRVAEELSLISKHIGRTI